MYIFLYLNIVLKLDILIMQVLGKCQLREAVEDKEAGLDSLGNVFDIRDNVVVVF